jgi:hypothetical protein
MWKGRREEYRLWGDRELSGEESVFKRYEVTAGWRKLQNKELHNLGDQIKEHETVRACSKNGMDEMHTKIESRNGKERDYLEYLGVDGRIISRWIFKKVSVKLWAGFIWLRIRTSGGIL